MAEEAGHASSGPSDFRARAYRHAAPPHAEIGPALLEGSRRLGGRFNPRGEFGALYVSLDSATARAELKRRAARTGVAPEDLLPRVLLVVVVELGRVLDLGDPEERARWGLDEGSLAGDDHRPCQEVGRAARREGYEAILYPSVARPRGTNLVVFLDRLHPGSEVRVEGREDLRLREDEAGSRPVDPAARRSPLR